MLVATKASFYCNGMSIFFQDPFFTSRARKAKIKKGKSYLSPLIEALTSYRPIESEGAQPQSSL